MQHGAAVETHRFNRWLQPGFGLAVFAVALWLLHRELAHYRLAEVRESLRDLPRAAIGRALLLTAFNYVVLIGYDWLALRTLGHRMKVQSFAMASCVGWVASYNFGGLLGGTSARYRMYSALGLNGFEIVQFVLLLVVMSWGGFFLVAAIVFLIEPVPIPAALHVPLASSRVLGVVLLVPVLAYLLVPGGGGRRWTVRGYEVPLPSLRTKLAQFGVAGLDLCSAAGALYVLLPASSGLTYFQLLGVYLLAVVAMYFSQVPGGLGVLELIILTFSKGDAHLVAASLIAYRVIYYLVPLATASVIMVLHELWQRDWHKGKVATVAETAWKGALPSVISWACFALGVVLLISGATPELPHRLRALENILPLAAVEASHFLASLSGAGLLILGRGLQRRLDSAWWGAVLLLLAAVIFSLAKGLDYEEAFGALLLLCILLPARKEFYRRGSVLHPTWTPGWVAAVVIAVLCSVWLGIFAHKHIEYSNELWWRFAFRADAPRILRAEVGVIVFLLGFAVLKLLSGAHVRPAPSPSEEAMARVEGIVAASRGTVANLALLGDKAFLFNEERTAFLMYAVKRRSWVVMGDPVGPEGAWGELIWQFREECDRYDAWPVFYQVAPEHLTLYLDQGFTLLKLGETALVDLAQFSLEGGRRKGLRSNRNKLIKDGCGFRIVPKERVPHLLPRLREISDAWLAEKHGEEKGFSLGYFDEEYLCRFPCAVVESRGVVIAFANLWLGAEKEEFSIDLMRHDPSSPHGIMDYLFCELMLWGKQAGYRWFDLGMAPLSGIEARKFSPLWNKVAALIFRLGDQFYSFEGLREYKDKFDPVWSPRYLASPGGLALPRVLTDVTMLIRKRPAGGT